MPRTILWLGAVICTGWSCSDAFAFGFLARLREGQGTVISADTPAPPGTTIVNGQIINGDSNGVVAGDCSAGRHGICGGHLGGLGGRLEGAKAHINAWLLDVPQKKAPAAPPPVPINPFVRSPRDYFMVGDP
jgi:hypothetical protein